MKKKLTAWPVILLIVVLIVLVYNITVKCSEYGGFVGIIKTCTCIGTEVPNPLDSLKQSIPGGSSTVCLGVQLPKK